MHVHIIEHQLKTQNFVSNLQVLHHHLILNPLNPSKCIFTSGLLFVINLSKYFRMKGWGKCLSYNNRSLSQLKSLLSNMVTIFWCSSWHKTEYVFLNIVSNGLFVEYQSQSWCRRKGATHQRVAECWYRRWSVPHTDYWPPYTFLPHLTSPPGKAIKNERIRRST